MPSRKLLLLATVLLSAMALAGCETTGSQGTKLVVPCENLAPFRWSHKDTPESITQAVGYNAVGKTLCHWQNANPTFSWANVPIIGGK